MPTIYEPIAEWVSSYPIPSDGDAPTASAFGVPYESLGDRTEALKARGLMGLYHNEAEDIGVTAPGDTLDTMASVAAVWVKSTNVWVNVPNTKAPHAQGDDTMHDVLDWTLVASAGLSPIGNHYDIQHFVTEAFGTGGATDSLPVSSLIRFYAGQTGQFVLSGTRIVALDGTTRVGIRARVTSGNASILIVNAWTLIVRHWRKVQA